MIENLKFLRRIVSNENKTPLYIIFFITSRCNMRCKHCFFWKELNKIPELSVSEIEKVSKSMDDLLFMRLTGGEPFLRQDISDIVGIFHKNNSLKNLGINTNGFFSERIIENVRKILQKYPINLDVCISIDDIEPSHDKNRGVKGAFSHAIQSLRQLNNLKKDFPNLTTTAGLTVFSENQDRLDEIFNEIKKANPTFISANLVRGNPESEEIKNVDIRRYLDFVAKISAYNKKKHNFYFNTQFKDKLLSKKVADTFSEKKYQGIKCAAADKIAVMHSNGDVYPCEIISEKIGNIKETGYDFKKLWMSEKRRSISKRIVKNRCFCTHECFLTSSIMLSPNNLFRCMIRG